MPCIEARLTTSEQFKQSQQPTQTQQKQTLNTLQAAELIGIAKRTLQEFMATNEITYVKIGKVVRFRPEDITAFIDRKLVKASAGEEGSRP